MRLHGPDRESNQAVTNSRRFTATGSIKY